MFENNAFSVVLHLAKYIPILLNFYLQKLQHFDILYHVMVFNALPLEGQECQNILPLISYVKRQKMHSFQQVEIRTCHMRNLVG
jgi:hypothetical protein